MSELEYMQAVGHRCGSLHTADGRPCGQWVWRSSGYQFCRWHRAKEGEREHEYAAWSEMREMMREAGVKVEE
jgi:hypothetical protein